MTRTGIDTVATPVATWPVKYYKDRALSDGSAIALHPAVVVESRREGARKLAIRVARPNLHDNIQTVSRYNTPGQFVIADVDLPGDGAFFAIANPPSADATFLELLVKTEGFVAERIAKANVGDLIGMSDPIGGGFPTELPTGSRVVVFAAGSGIAPVRALLDDLVGRRSSVADVMLFYGQASAEEFSYRDWLATLSGCGVSHELALSRPQSGWTGPIGYVQDVADRDDVFASPSSTYVYACGMDAMLEGVRELCARRGVAADHVLTNLG